MTGSSKLAKYEPTHTLDVVGPRQDVVSFTKLHDAIYVLCNDSIERYSGPSFQQDHQLALDDIGINNFVFSGLTASFECDCLYLGDRANRCVWQIFRQEIMCKSISKPCLTIEDKKENVYSVSWTPERTLVVLTGREYRGGKVREGIIRIYDTTFKLLNQHSLPKIGNPCGISSIKQGTFFVTFDNSRGGGVYEYDPNGRLRKYKKCKLKLMHPRKCHYERHRGNGLIPDVGNNRVLLLDRKLRLQQILLSFTTNSVSEEDMSNDQLNSKPFRAFLDDEKRQLFVAMLSGRISLYSV